MATYDPPSALRTVVHSSPVVYSAVANQSVSPWGPNWQSRNRFFPHGTVPRNSPSPKHDNFFPDRLSTTTPTPLTRHNNISLPFKGYWGCSTAAATPNNNYDAVTPPPASSYYSTYPAVSPVRLVATPPPQHHYNSSYNSTNVQNDHTQQGKRTFGEGPFFEGKTLFTPIRHAATPSTVAPVVRSTSSPQSSLAERRSARRYMRSGSMNIGAEPPQLLFTPNSRPRYHRGGLRRETPFPSSSCFGGSSEPQPNSAKKNLSDTGRSSCSRRRHNKQHASEDLKVELELLKKAKETSEATIRCLLDVVASLLKKCDNKLPCSTTQLREDLLKLKEVSPRRQQLGAILLGGLALAPSPRMASPEETSSDDDTVITKTVEDSCIEIAMAADLVKPAVDPWRREYRELRRRQQQIETAATQKKSPIRKKSSDDDDLQKLTTESESLEEVSSNGKRNSPDIYNIATLREQKMPSEERFKLPAATTVVSSAEGSLVLNNPPRRTSLDDPRKSIQSQYCASWVPDSASLRLSSEDEVTLSASENHPTNPSSQYENEKLRVCATRHPSVGLVAAAEAARAEMINSSASSSAESFDFEALVKVDSKKTTSRRPSEVPKLGLNGVGTGSWMSGVATIGDTYVD